MDEFVTVTTGTGLIGVAAFLGLVLFGAAFLNGLALLRPGRLSTPFGPRLLRPSAKDGHRRAQPRLLGLPSGRRSDRAAR